MCHCHAKINKTYFCYTVLCLLHTEKSAWITVLLATSCVQRTNYKFGFLTNTTTCCQRYMRGTQYHFVLTIHRALKQLSSSNCSVAPTASDRKILTFSDQSFLSLVNFSTTFVIFISYALFLTFIYGSHHQRIFCLLQTWLLQFHVRLSSSNAVKSPSAHPECCCSCCCGSCQVIQSWICSQIVTLAQGTGTHLIQSYLHHV